MSVQKTIQDYYDIIIQKYPTIPKQDIKRILLYGWKSLYLHNSYGGDVLLKKHKFWLFCGTLTNNSIRYFNYYKRKIRLKLRVMYKKKKIQWNGYYYFALSKNDFDNYKSLINKRGRPRKNFSFNKIILYKIYDECAISESGKVAIFKTPMPLDLGFTLYKEIFNTNNIELVLEREPLKLKDILTSNYNYEFI